MNSYKKENMTNVNKIGVIMFGLLGDILLRTPVLQALKDIYPDAELIGIVDPVGRIVLQSNPYVDKTIVILKSKENKLQKNIDKFKGILHIREEKFDLIVNLYNGGSSPLMVFLSGARYKLGFCNQKNSYIYNVLNECADDRLKDAQTLNSYMISIIEPLSDKKYSLQPVFDISSEISKNILTYLLSFDYELNKIYILNLGSSKEDKILENAKYLHLVQYIYSKFGFIPAIVSNPEQEYLQEVFINNYLKPKNIPYIKLDPMSLEKVASVIKLTKFIVTPDTGLMHLAMAFDNYIYTIFTYTHPIFVDPENEKFIAVYEAFDDGKLYQHQNIQAVTLEKNVDLLFEKL